MKKIAIIFSSFVLLFAASCGKDVKTVGTLVFEIREELEILDRVKSQVSDYTALPEAEEFNILINNDSNARVWEGKISEWNTATAIPMGSYTVTASYGSEDIEGFDKPCFRGETSFTIVGGESANVIVPVKLKNCIVRLTCTKTFKNYFPEYSFTLTTGGGSVATFDNSDSKPMFMDAYKFSISGTLINQAGYSKSFGPKEYDDLEEATCYTLKFDASNIGNVKISISFNDTVETIDLGDIELN